MIAASDDNIEGYPTIEPWLGENHYNESPKFWYSHIRTKDGKESLNLNYKIAGDSTVNGKTYAKVVLGYETTDDLKKNYPLEVLSIYPTGEDSYADTLLFRQERDKVFYLSDKDMREVTILDYGLKEGDIFIDATGKRFVVEKVESMGKDAYGIQYWYESSPKRLFLVSEESGLRNIWIEGVGSLNWGIIPPFLLDGISPLKEKGMHVQEIQTAMSWGSNFLATFCVNQPDYKFVPFEPDNYEGMDEVTKSEDKGEFLEYKFVDDTLWITGFMELNCYLTYAECIVSEKRIDVMVKQAYAEDVFDCLHDAFVNVRIPGFKAGIYEIGLPNKEHVTVECKGADGIKDIGKGKLTTGHDGPAYDLSGRHMSDGQRGLRIQGGKKFLVPLR